jgi:hypothetical protein
MRSNRVPTHNRDEKTNIDPKLELVHQATTTTLCRCHRPFPRPSHLVTPQPCHSEPGESPVRNLLFPATTSNPFHHHDPLSFPNRKPGEEPAVRHPNKHLTFSTAAPCSSNLD